MAQALIAAAGFNSLTGGAQMKEQEDWGDIWGSSIMRYILIFGFSWVATKRWRIACLVLIGWIILKAILKTTNRKTPDNNTWGFSNKTKSTLSPKDKQQFRQMIKDALD